MLSRSDKVGEAEHEYNEVSLLTIGIYGLCEILYNWLLIVMQLKAESEQATETYETIVKLMNEEIVSFQEQKTSDLGIAFHEFAKGQARLANGTADGWRSLLPQLKAYSSS